MRRELSFKDKAALTKFLAKRALLSKLASDAYFKYLVTRSDFDENLRLGGSSGFQGSFGVDAQQIVDWAIGVGTNPKDRNQALGGRRWSDPRDDCGWLGWGLPRRGG